MAGRDAGQRYERRFERLDERRPARIDRGLAKQVRLGRENGIEPAAGKGGGVGACDLHARCFGAGEAGIVRRGRVRRKSLIGDNAAALPRRAAERNRPKRAADVLAFWDLDIEAEDEGAGEEALLGLALDLVGDESR